MDFPATCRITDLDDLIEEMEETPEQIMENWSEYHRAFAKAYVLDKFHLSAWSKDLIHT